VEPVIIIVNPAAGRGQAGAALGRIQKWVRQRAPEVELLISEYPGHATELVRQAPPDARIVAVGGDGTVHEVVGGLGKSWGSCPSALVTTLPAWLGCYGADWKRL